MDTTDRVQAELGRMASLLYVVDPMCSWCWGFAPVVRRLRDEADHAVEVIVGGLRAGETRGMTAETRHTIQHHWQQVAATTGQPFQFEGALPDGFVYDTEPACRAVVTMRELRPEVVLEYLHDIQQAFYAQGQDIKLGDVLAELAGRQGVDEALFTELWQSDGMRLATAGDFERKDQYGIMGFPALLVDTGQRMRLVSMGYQDYDTICRQIERRLAAEAKGMR